MNLRLRLLQPDDEAALRLACRTMEPSDFEFAFAFDDDTDFAEYLEWLERHRKGVVDRGLVPATYLVADVGGEIVGRVSIRHKLNRHLRRIGGHIGYGVLPGARRRGYATEMLRQALVEAHRLGIAEALLTCDDTNTASRRVIERCGGRYEPTKASRAAGVRRYWITTG